MFEIGFQELVLVFVIALVVLGPERLPGLARNVGRWAGRARTYLRHFTAEFERELNVHEARQQMIELQKIVKESAEVPAKPTSTQAPPPKEPVDSE